MKYLPLRLLGMALVVILAVAAVYSSTPTASAAPDDGTYQALPFTQNWTNTGLITTNDDWSGVPGIIGYRGDALTNSPGTDPQTTVADGTGTVDVNANQTNPNTFATGGVAEFEITDPVVALAGSGTADAPFILIHLNATGSQNIRVQYNLRDIDGSADNAVQQIALQYRVGASGNFTNLPAGYVADATTGPSQATQVTAVDVTLPAAADNQAQLQVRIITNDAVGADEFVGIDDINITAGGGGGTATPTGTATNTPTVTPTATVEPGNNCGDAATLISAVQGSAVGTGSVSPLNGSTQTIEGIVVADFEGAAPNLQGFHVQEEDAQQDGNVLTSEGIFVFNGSNNSVAVGDKVRVRGTVQESFGQTQLGGTLVIVPCGTAPLPTPATITLPVAATTIANGVAIADYEQYEGMYVQFTQTLFVTEHFTLGRFGELSLSIGNFLFQPTNIVEPGAPANAQQDLNNRSRVLVDDANGTQNPAIVPHLSGDGVYDTLRIGDSTVQPLLGVMGYGFNNYRVQPNDQEPSGSDRDVLFADTNPRDATPEPVGDGSELRVANFNVLNYFNGDGAGGGFPTSRGANTLAEFNRQRAKTIQAIIGLDADVVGLIEMENDGTGANSALQDLVNGLNAVAGPGTYSFVVEPSPGSDEIKVSIIYRSSVVTPIGATLNDTNPVHNRPPLAQRFQENSSGEQFWFVINHFKSKSCTGATGGDLDQGDGQACFNPTRINQANALLSFISTNLTPVDPDVLTVGDYNAYAKEDPIDIIAAAGYTRLGPLFEPASEQYSFVFQGQAGELDHAFGTAGLATQVTGVTTWHINSPEPIILDYNQEFNPPYLYQPNQFRSSDHDPVVVGLELRAPTTSPADLSDAPPSYGVAFHTAPHNRFLGTSVDDDPNAAPGQDDNSDDGSLVRDDLPEYRPGGKVQVDVTVTGGSGFVGIWADWNNDGDFFDVNERVASGLPASVGPNSYTGDIPAAAAQGTLIRFRVRLYETNPNAAAEGVGVGPLPTGGAIGGEVEDITSSRALAVTLATFQAVSAGDHIAVSWESASEVNLFGYNLLRGTTATEPTEQLNDEIIPATAPGGGGAVYDWQDFDVAEGQVYFYWLDAVDTDGTTTRFGPVSAELDAPTAVSVTTVATTPSSTLPLVLAIAGLVGLVVVGWALRRR